MRCGCPECGAFMIQSEAERSFCVCPDCGFECKACLGAGRVYTLKEIQALQSFDQDTQSPE